MSEDKGEMTVQEAGRRGGSRVKEKYGAEFYREIGKKGGTETSKRFGREFFQEIGRRGGLKGGRRMKELIDAGKRAAAEEEAGG